MTMAEQQQKTTLASAGKPIRPVLIVSQQTAGEYAMVLERLMVGLTSESIPSMLVWPAGCPQEPVATHATTVVGYPILDLPFMQRRNVRLLASQLAEFDPTVLHCVGAEMTPTARMLAAVMDLPYVLSVWSVPQAHRWLSMPARAAGRLLSRLKVPDRCARILAPAESIAAQLRRRLPHLAERVDRVNIGTFVAENAPCLFQPGRPLGMVSICPLDSAERFEPLLAALRHLLIDGYEFMFVVMGSGRGELRLRRLLEILGLVDVVTVVPEMPNRKSVLKAAQVYIRGQVRDAFDPFLLEAMGAGMAVAAAAGGVEDLLIDGQTCILFDPDDEQSIYNALRRLLQRPELTREIGEGAWRFVREQHSVADMVAQIIRTYRDAQQWYQGR